MVVFSDVEGGRVKWKISRFEVATKMTGEVAEDRGSSARCSMPRDWPFRMWRRWPEKDQKIMSPSAPPDNTSSWPSGVRTFSRHLTKSKCPPVRDLGADFEAGVASGPMSHV